MYTISFYERWAHAHLFYVIVGKSLACVSFLPRCFAFSVMAVAVLHSFLDSVQKALTQLWEAYSCCEDLDGVLIRLDIILQCLLRVEPIFTLSVKYSNLWCAVSDMITHVHSILEQNFHSHRVRPQLSISEAALSAFLEQDFTQVEVDNRSQKNS